MMLLALLSQLASWAVSSAPPADPDKRLKEAFGGRIVMHCWLVPLPAFQRENPCTLEGDFDGDGQKDVAVLVRQATSPQKRGVVILLKKEAYLLGAGKRLVEDNDDFDWMDTWAVLERPPDDTGKRRPDALILEKTEAGGNLVTWNGKRFVASSHGD